MNIFDPWNDRRSRDLRNLLARRFLAALAGGGDPAHLAGWQQAVAGLQPHHLAWGRERVAIYQKFLAEGGEEADPLALFCRMWNKGLFFEAHELLEDRWRDARGRRRTALQALIRAAGSRVHLEAGHHEAARRQGRRCPGGPPGPPAGLGRDPGPLVGRSRPAAAGAPLP